MSTQYVLPAIETVKTPAGIRAVATAMTLGFVLLVIALAFMPWQQNISGAGKVTALSPIERQQSIDSPVDGRIVKHDNELVDIDLASVRRTVEATVEHLRSTLGEEAWNAGMHPEIPDSKVLDNPYQYTDFSSSDTHRSRDAAETAG